eukprot:COSAG02_NODE_3699_length_6364_cov_1.588132_1_plen_268_part_00
MLTNWYSCAASQTASREVVGCVARLSNEIIISFADDEERERREEPTRCHPPTLVAALLLPPLQKGGLSRVAGAMTTEFRTSILCVLVLWATTDVCAQDCAAGTEPDGSGGCADCPAGAFSAALDDSSCDACPVGSFAAEGATSCASCVAGFYDHDQNATTACEHCPIGTFSLEDRAQACQSCQDGSRWLRVHGDSRMQPTACDICPVGFFEPQLGADHCEFCPTGSFSPPVRPQSTECAVQDLILEWEVSASHFRTAQTASLACLTP